MSTDRANPLLWIGLHGPPLVTWAEQAVPIARRQTRALLYRLAADLRPVSRDQLCYLFWPDVADAIARRNLTRLLVLVRRSLPQPAVLLTDDTIVTLDREQVWCDTAAFVRLTATTDLRVRRRALQQAINLSRGPFLDGFALPDCPEFDAWMDGERRTWERRMLATSRALLHITGEHSYSVPPLALPDPAQLPPLEALAQVDSIALFLARVRTRLPAFRLTETNAHDVAAICARLDGLPLAIELAAARAALLAPRMLLARLSSRLTLLTGGPRDLPERQRTLRATIDWSYRLLDLSEQLLFGRLAVFAGSWSLEAAEAVCGAVGLLATSTLDGLQALLDQHLVQRVGDVGGEPGFTMLETIREYALERLAERGEARAAQQAHAQYSLARAESAAPALHGPVQIAWFDRLDEEQANLRVALEALALDKLGEVARLMGADTAAAASYAASLRIERDLDSRLEIARLTHNLGYLALHAGDTALARARFTKSLAGFRASGQPRGQAEALAGLAAVAADARTAPATLLAARLWGAATAVHTALGTPVWPADQAEIARYQALARATVGSPAFEAAYADGAALSFEHVVAEALRV